MMIWLKLTTFLFLFSKIIKYLIQNAQSWKTFFNASKAPRKFISKLRFFKYNYATLFLLPIGYLFVIDKYLWLVTVPIMGSFFLYDKEKGFSQFSSLFHAFDLLSAIIVLCAANFQNLMLISFVLVVVSIIVHAFLNNGSRKMHHHHRNSRQNLDTLRLRNDNIYSDRRGSEESPMAGIFILIVACGVAISLTDCDRLKKLQSPNENSTLSFNNFDSLSNSSLINSISSRHCNSTVMCCKGAELHSSRLVCVLKTDTISY